ncbi:MAG: helix-turn-helix transcriptional regulator, partial [Actinomycetota bacterium]
KPTKTSERLGRMLVIVPYLVQHPGSELARVAASFDITEDQLRRDLDLLFMSGLPPYGPGDLIEVDVDEDDRIWIAMAEHFARPLQLSRIEALALYVRAIELRGTPGLPEAPALASAQEKLRRSLGPETLGDVERIEMAQPGRPVAHLDVLREAARERRRLRIDYFAHSSGEWSRREIEPEEVFSSLGHWYVVAWDVAADAERLFRADRIREASPTGERFEPRGLRGAGRPLYTPSEQDVPVRLRLAPGGRWIAEYYAVTDEEEAAEGHLDVTLPARSLGWVAELLLRVGPEATVLAPPELLGVVRDLARRTLDGYAG